MMTLRLCSRDKFVAFARAYYWTVMLLAVSVFSVGCTKPNIVLLVADDMGYSDLGAFGSEIKTPNIDELAESGVIFNDFYTASACSPTRAMLMTGVDHHIAGMGTMAEFIGRTTNQQGKPGYEGHLNSRVAPVAGLLKDAGYNTYVAGKWHLGTTAEQSPTAKGFTRSFTMMQGAGNHIVPQPNRTFWGTGDFEEYPVGEFSTKVYTDKLLEFLEADAADGKPFFLYAAYTAPHWPLQVPDDYLDKYKGVYDEGFDKLRLARFEGLKRKGLIPQDTVLPELPDLQAGFLNPATPRPSWDDLTVEQKQISARAMELYAAMLDNMDFHIGRLIQHLKDTGQYHNTMFVFISDHGADAVERNRHPDDVTDILANMGKVTSDVRYGAGWAHASTAPYRLYKAYSTLGGIHAPMIVKLPGLDNGGRISNEFTTVLDLVPTFLQAAGAEYPDDPAIHPLQGASLLPHLVYKNKPVHPPDYVMGWELFGRAALRQGDWFISKVPAPMGTGEFQLFNLAEDLGETNDLSQQHPEKFAEMTGLYDKYVQDNGVVEPIWK